MGQHALIDAASTFDRRARKEGWPFRCAAAANFERPELNAIADIWRGLAASNPMPSRADFDARTLKPFLRNITIIERIFTDATHWRYRTRLSGAAVVEAVGDHIGRYLEEYLPADSVPRWTAAYDAVIDSGEPLKLLAEFTHPRLNFLKGEAFLAPLRDTEGRPAFVLGCIYFKPKNSNA